MRKKIVPIVSIVFKTTASKDSKCEKELSLLSLLSLKQPQAKVSFVVKNNRKQETDILSYPEKR